MRHVGPCPPLNVYASCISLTAVLEAIDFLGSLKAYACLPGFIVVAIRLCIPLM